MKFFKKSLVSIFIGAFALLVTVHAAFAIGIDLDKIKPLSEVEYIPQEEFDSQTRLIEETPFEDDFLSYQIRLPKDWGENTQTSQATLESKGMSQRVLGPVARYTSPPKDHLRSFLTIETLELTYEIGARNWFINYIISNGLSLEQVGVESRKQVEAVYIEVQGDTEYIVRVKVILNGPRMVVIRHYLPKDLYNAERIQQAQIIKSFELTNREEVGVEKLEIYGFLDQSYFDYPVSWTLSPSTVRSIDRMKSMLYHSTVKDRLDGQINIYLTNKLVKTTRSKEITHYKEKFQIKDYELGEYIETPKMEYHDDMNFGVTEAYKMVSQVAHMFGYEFWISVLEGEEYIYIITLLTPARDEDFFVWARNVEAYKLVLKGMRRNDDSVDYYRFIQ